MVGMVELASYFSNPERGIQGGTRCLQAAHGLIASLQIPPDMGVLVIVHRGAIRLQIGQALKKTTSSGAYAQLTACSRQTTTSFWRSNVNSRVWDKDRFSACDSS